MRIAVLWKREAERLQSQNDVLKKKLPETADQLKRA